MSPGFHAVLLHRQYGEKEQYEDGQVGEEDDDLDDAAEKQLPDFKDGAMLPLLGPSPDSGSLRHGGRRRG